MDAVYHGVLGETEWEARQSKLLRVLWNTPKIRQLAGQEPGETAGTRSDDSG